MREKKELAFYNPMVEKGPCLFVNFAILAEHRVKMKESEKIDKYLDLSWELKNKVVRHKSDGSTNCDWCPRNGPKEVL